MVALLVALGLAQAQDLRQSVDIELVHPVPTCEAVAGVERAGPWEPCVVVSGQLEDGPLVFYRDDERVVDLVTYRGEVRVGLLLPVGPHSAFTASLPAVAQWGSADSAYSADGLYLADAGVGLRWWLHRGEHLGLSFRLDARLPIGGEDAWVGERGFRVGPALNASLDAGRLGVDLDASLWNRRLMTEG